MGVAEWVAAQMQREERDDIETPQTRVTIRLDAEDLVRLDAVAKYLDLSRTGCATRLLIQAVKEAVGVISEEDHEWGGDLTLAVVDAMEDR